MNVGVEPALEIGRRLVRTLDFKSQTAACVAVSILSGMRFGHGTGSGIGFHKIGQRDSEGHRRLSGVFQNAPGPWKRVYVPMPRLYLGRLFAKGSHFVLANDCGSAFQAGHRDHFVRPTPSHRPQHVFHLFCRRLGRIDPAEHASGPSRRMNDEPSNCFRPKAGVTSRQHRRQPRRHRCGGAGVGQGRQPSLGIVGRGSQHFQRGKM